LYQSLIENIVLSFGSLLGFSLFAVVISFSAEPYGVQQAFLAALLSSVGSTWMGFMFPDGVSSSGLSGICF
jgi:hypothetical protein